jgi:DNA-binding LacI/PurR family transcriptional regulator
MVGRAERVTLAKVAEAAAVSVSAVSAVLRGQSRQARISESTERQIRDAATRLGYRPNASARAMQSGRFGAAALLVPAERSGYLPGTLALAVMRSLAGHDLTFSLAEAPFGTVSDDAQLPRLLRELSVDGLLIDFLDELPPGMVDVVRAHRVPTVYLNTKQPSDCVRPDDLGAGRDAAEFLMKRGHERIAFLDFASPSEGVPSHYSTDDRIRGCRAAMKAAGLRTQVLRFEFSPYARRQRAKGDGRLKQLTGVLDASDRPTAVIANENTAALPLAYAARERGLVLGEDLSVVAFSDKAVEDTGVPITTFAHFNGALGKAAGDTLARKIRHPEEALPPVLVPFTKRPGFTVGKPRTR